MSTELKVGIFVFFIIIIFVVLSMKIGEFNTNRKDTYPMSMIFSSAEGLKEGAPIEVAGIKVGSVKDITLNDDYSAVVHAAIDNDVKIPVDTVASLGTKGVVGDRFINLDPGESTEVVPHGGVLANTKTPTSLDALVAQLNDVAKGLDAVVGDVRAGQGTVGKLVTDDELYVSLVETIKDIQAVTKKLNNKNTLTLLLSDDQLYYDLVDTSSNLKKISSDIAAGKGTLGKLLADEALYNELKLAIKNANQAAQGVKEQTPISVMGTVLGTILK